MGIDDNSIQSSVTKNMDANLIQLGISLLSGLACLLPLAFQIPNCERSQLRKGLHSSRYRGTAVMIIALVIPIIMDTLADIINYSNKKRPKRQESGTFFNINERVLFLCGMIICPITVFLPRETPNLAFIYMCCNKSQLVISYGVLVTCLCRYKKEFWSVRSTYIQLSMMCVGIIGTACVNNLFAKDPADYLIFMWVAWTFMLFATALFFLCSGRWLFSKIKIIRSEKRFKFPGNFYFPMILNITAVASASLLIYVLFHHGSVYKWDVTALLLNNLAYILYLFAYYFVMIRMVKYEVVQGLYALIDSKKSYVRYISHELRTPLNAAFLGLKFLIDEIEGSTDPKDIDRYNTLCDVYLACRTAVDILNDLLCFDKIESGVLEVHKHEVLLLPFIKDCVGMFSTQAKECGVNLSIVKCADKEHHIHHMALPLHSPLRESDTVSMDKFKMDQVLRNLVSNALKFTPRGGSVSVSAVFVPSKDDSNRILSGSKSASGDSFVMRLMGSSTVTITDHVQDLETGIRSEDGILHNHIDETHSDSTIEDENDIAYGKLLIVVRDSGVGMSKENQKRLFHEVVQFNPEVLQAGGGSGLGLWITNNIVNMHDGKVSVYSAGENSGCSFSVEVDMQRKIPKLHCDDPAPIEISRTLQAFQAVQALRCDGKEMETMDMGVELGLGCMDHLTGLTAVASNYRRSSIKSLSEVGIGIPSPRKPIYNILMVDDSGLNRKLLGKLLRSAGHVVEEAEDGLQAVEVMKTRIGTDKEYDIILMDFIMPKMDGPSATKAIRALGYTSPIFGVTGNAVDSDVEHFLGHGADRVMIKPFDLQLFNQNITEMIAARDSLSNCG